MPLPMLPMPPMPLSMALSPSMPRALPRLAGGAMSIPRGSEGGDAPLRCEESFLYS